MMIDVKTDKEHWIDYCNDLIDKVFNDINSNNVPRRIVATLITGIALNYCVNSLKHLRVGKEPYDFMKYFYNEVTEHLIEHFEEEKEEEIVKSLKKLHVEIKGTKDEKRN
jgi:predicted flavoprotein YhiN